MLYDRSFAYTVFCDDIRFEQGGKHSFIGVYQADLRFHGVTLPTILPKFGFAVVYWEEIHAFKGDPEIRIYLPTDPDESPTIVIPMERTQKPVQARAAEMGTFHRFFAPIIVANLQINSEGLIRVRVHCDGIETKAGALTVAIAPTTP